MVTYSYDAFMETHLGILGKYQMLLITIASLDPITYAFYTLGPVFFASTPPHTCAPDLVPYNCTQEEWGRWGVPRTCTQDGGCTPDPCKMYLTNTSGFVNCTYGGDAGWTEMTEACSAWTYGESFYPDSAVTEWDLVCDRRGHANTITGAYMLGRCVGCLLLGWVADKFGRRKAMLSMTVLTFVCAISAAFVTNLYVFLVLRFLIAVFDMARSNIGFILGVEFVHSSRRSFFVGYWSLFWVLGSVLLAGAAFIIRQWRTLLLVSALPEILIFIIELLALPESPRWLLLKERKEEARQFIEKVAKFNKVKLPENWDVVAEEKSITEASLMDLIRSPRIALMTVVMAYIFFANSFVYYGLSLNTSKLAGNEYVNFFISGAIEFPAYTFIAFFYERINRRPPFCFCLLSGGALLLATITVPKELGWVVVVLSMTGKFFITISFIITWLVVSEVFPTAIRGVALGITNATARMASFLSAYVGLLVSIHVSLPAVIFSLASILAGLLILVLPETRGTVLRQTVQEGEAFIAHNMCRIGGCRKEKTSDTNAEMQLQEMADTKQNE